MRSLPLTGSRRKGAARREGVRDHPARRASNSKRIVTMSENLFKLWTTQFSTNLELKLQQMGSKLRGKVREGFHVGKMASPINQVGAIQLKAPAGRFSPKNRTDADFTRRWVFPQDGEIDQLIDSFDELKTIVDPKSMYAENAAMAVGRGWDDALIAAAFGTAQVGQDANGLTAETWASFNSAYAVSDTFGSSASSGLIVDKLIEAKRIFRHNHNDLENDPLTLVIGSKQESDLLRQVQVVSTEFNDKPVLVDGRVVRFLGFDIVVSERLTVTSNLRQVIATVKSGMYLGMWRDTTNRVSIRNDLSGEPYDLYTAASFGATRTQPGKVVQILCADTTGSDITP
jgi:hypothetical protein